MSHERSPLRDPVNWPMLVYRLGRAAQNLPPPLRGLGSRLYGAAKLGLDITIGTVLHRETEIGEGLCLIHAHNIKIHPKAVLGARVRLNHDVTIGVQHEGERPPIIGNDVLIGAGAKVLGPITIGDGAVIAANSLVMSDIPAHHTAMGVPARPLPRKHSEVETKAAFAAQGQPPARRRS